MGKKVTGLRQSVGEVEIINATTSTKSSLSNRMLLSILFLPFIFVSTMLSLKEMNFVFPAFEQLLISSGTIGFDPPINNRGALTLYPLYLDDGKKRIWFDDGLNDKEQVNQYRGKRGKIWWYHTSTGDFGRKFLQLEVDRQIVIAYATRKSEYFSNKQSNQRGCFILTALWLFLFFIVDKPMYCKVSKLEPKNNAFKND